MSMHARARELFATLQDEISAKLEQVDGKATFREDRWRHEAGGGGITRVMADGEVFEKGGVNLADVRGALSGRLAQRLGVPSQGYEATGISIVIHPSSPLVPTVHMNLRHLRLADGVEWFGGGADLTPYYLYEEDARHFHRTWKSACDRHDPAFYPRFKKACDEYFHLSHRGEARGIGGIFFDYLKEEPEKAFALVEEIGRRFLEAYLPIVERRMGGRWSERERSWQLVRRGRYVEFNLVHDRGTLFGLETRGRTESILMSLPPLVRWSYDHRPEPGSREAALLELLAAPRDWV